jgi:acyl carrier protein
MLTAASFKNIPFKIKHEQEETLLQLRNIVKPYIVCEAFENFTEDTDFITDLNINSCLVDIILDVEDYFKIHIDNESMEMIDVKSTRNNRN